MNKIFGIKNCDTMKKAMNWLTENGVAYEFIDYKKAGVAEAHLPDWCPVPAGKSCSIRAA
jgi:arsenate reductase